MIICIDDWQFELDLENKKLYYLGPVDAKEPLRKEFIPNCRKQSVWAFTQEYLLAENKAKKLLKFRLELQQVLA